MRDLLSGVLSMDMLGFFVYDAMLNTDTGQAVSKFQNDLLLVIRFIMFMTDLLRIYRGSVVIMVGRGGEGGATFQ